MVERGIMNDFDALKVFFLYPHVPGGLDIVRNIVFNEYEAYSIGNHYAMLELTRQYNNSMLFVNPDYKMKPDDWSLYMKSIAEDPETYDVKLGVLTERNDEGKADNLFKDFMLQCGFIDLNEGVESCTECILKKLEEYQAKGRRKYLRVKCSERHEASFSVKYGSQIYQGEIHDISSAGIACTFSDDIEIIADTYLDDLQLRLMGKILRVSGKVFSSRKADDIVHVILFDYRKTYKEKQKIHNFIFNSLQRDMQKRVENLAR